MKLYTTMNELLDACDFTIKGKSDLLKAEKAWNLYTRATLNGDSGAFGKAREILSRRPNSRKARVSGRNESDITFKLDGKLAKAECKTSGGRINDIKDKYIVYSLSVHNSTGDKDISARIIRSDVFIAKLYELNAVKTVRHNGVIDGLAIQPAKRALWAWLEEQLEFNREWDYYSEDFEA